MKFLVMLQNFKLIGKNIFWELLHAWVSLVIALRVVEALV